MPPCSPVSGGRMEHDVAHGGSSRGPGATVRPATPWSGRPTSSSATASVAHVRPITPDDADGIRQLPRRPVRRVHLPALLRAAARAERPRRPPVHRTSTTTDRVALVATLRGRDHRHRALRPHRPRPPPRSPSTSPTTTRARASARSCSSTSPPSPRSLGITQFIAEVLPQNRKMLNVFKEAGYEVEHHIEDGVVEVSFDITPTDAVQRRAHRPRAPRRGAQHARAPHPRLVAVIGASRRGATRSARPCCATCSRASSPARCTP